MRGFRERKGNDEGGFTLVELMVVILITAILMAIAIPTFHGTSIEAADQKAQQLANAAADQVERVFSQSLSYGNLQAYQLGCTTGNGTAPCAAGYTGSWGAYSMTWNISNASGVSAAGTVGVLTWLGGLGNPCCNQAKSDDSAVTIAVTAAKPAKGCWIITLHSVGPRVYGYAPGDCSSVAVNWNETTPPFTVSQCCSESLQTNTFPADPNV